MSRYIDADALKESVNGVSTHWLNDWSTLGVLSMIDKQPTIDAVPVVHGEWKIGIDANGDPVTYCSNCKMPNYVQTNYCPNCGARMRGEQE